MEKLKTPLTESYWPKGDTSGMFDVSITQALHQATAECPDRIALVDANSDPAKCRRWTYAQRLKDVKRVASALLKRFKPGEHVAIWMPNCAEYDLLILGCTMAGVIFVPVIPALRPKELDYILRQSDSVGLILSDEFRGINMLEEAKEVCKGLPRMREMIRLAEFETFINSGNELAKFPETKPLDPFMLLYTSGTTGYPKGALVPGAGYVSAMKVFADRGGMEVGGTWLNAVPLFHMSGLTLMFCCLAKRGTHLVAPGFDPTLFFKLIESEKVVSSLFVPTMLEMLLKHPDRKNYNLSTFNRYVLGGAKIDPTLVTRVKDELGWIAMIPYGMTETGGGVSTTKKDDTVEDQVNTIGIPTPMCEVKIIDPATQKIVPVSQKGELCSRSEMHAKSYYKKPEETAAAIDAEGWLHTGDLATMDERGYLKIVGRLKELISRGAEKISPNEIEEFLKQHPKVGDAAAIGIPDDTWGEQVGVVIIPKSPENPPTPAELTEYCQAGLTSFKRPRFWYFAKELPMTPTGKVQKFALKDHIVKGELKAEPE